MAKPGTVLELQPEVPAETDAAAAGDANAAAADPAAADDDDTADAAAAPRRQQAACAVLSQSPSGHYIQLHELHDEGLFLVGKNV